MSDGDLVATPRPRSFASAVNFWGGKPGNVPHDGEPLITNWKQNVVDFTVGVTFH